MGWWKVEGSDDVVGDDVFSILRVATREIAQSYTQAWGRPPTRTEWQILVRDALEPVESLESSSKTSLFAEDSEPTSVNISLREAKR